MQAYLPQLQSNHDDAFLVSEFVTVYTSIPKDVVALLLALS